jgi:hypothetical protein
MRLLICLKQHFLLMALLMCPKPSQIGSRVSTKREIPDWPVWPRELGKQDGPQGEDT